MHRPLTLPTGPPSEGSTLLLYTLLHGSRSFREYVLVRSDVETLLLPLLGALYGASRSSANHLYMLQVRAAVVCLVCKHAPAVLGLLSWCQSPALAACASCCHGASWLSILPKHTSRPRTPVPRSLS